MKAINRNAVNLCHLLIQFHVLAHGCLSKKVTFERRTC